MKKKDEFNYYEAFKRQAGFAHEMAQNLQSALVMGELGEASLTQSLHTMENDADQVNHELHEHLASDFVVPLEREGLNDLAHCLDDVCDNIEDIALKAYMFGVSKLEPQGPEMITLMVNACVELKTAIDKLHDFKHHAESIKEHLVRVQTCESDCDRIYIESVRSLYLNKEMDPETRRIAHAMLDSVEDAMDALEKTSESAESVIAENL